MNLVQSPEMMGRPPSLFLSLLIAPLSLVLIHFLSLAVLLYCSCSLSLPLSPSGIKAGDGWWVSGSLSTTLLTELLGRTLLPFSMLFLCLIFSPRSCSWPPQ